jgi:hypothetical protein
MDDSNEEGTELLASGFLCGLFYQWIEGQYQTPGAMPKTRISALCLLVCQTI